MNQSELEFLASNQKLQPQANPLKSLNNKTTY